MSKAAANGRGRRRGKKNAISGQFAPRPIEMLESPAYRVLSLAAHRVLSRIEIELAHHAGKDNGRLPVTYRDFQHYGISLRVIAPAIRELQALGFIEVTERGCGGNADFRQPSLYRLTYRHADNQAGDGTHEWRQIASAKEAETLAKKARRDADPRKIAKGKKQNFAATLCSVSLPQSDSENARVPLPQSDSTVPLPQSGSTI
ncbi:MAG: hypothetical protein AB1508_16780 [Pseudomonadota bacterium]